MSGRSIETYLVYYKSRLIANNISYNLAISSLHKHLSNTEDAKLKNYHIVDTKHRLVISLGYATPDMVG